MQTIKKIPVKGLVTLLTGSASQLGSNVRQRLAINGAKIIALDINHKTIVAEDPDFKTNVSFVTGNVCDHQFMSNLFDKYNKLDAIVNCAASQQSYNYFTSYLVSKHGLSVMKNNDINSFGCRGCVINIIAIKAKYDQNYLKEQELFAQKHDIDIDSIDDKVYELAEQLTAARIRCNSILVKENSDLSKVSNLIQCIIEDQYVAGQIINMEDDYKPFANTVEDIRSEYHVPKDPETRQKEFRERDKESNKQIEAPVLRLGSFENNK